MQDGDTWIWQCVGSALGDAAGCYASQSGASGSCPEPLTTIPSTTCSIVSFGAVGDGVTDNATAIQNTFNYAAAHNCAALIPAGTFAYSGTLTANGIAVTGTGAASILKPLDVSNSAIILTGSGSSVSNLVTLNNATTRLSAPSQEAIYVNNATNYTI